MSPVSSGFPGLNPNPEYLKMLSLISFVFLQGTADIVRPCSFLATAPGMPEPEPKFGETFGFARVRFRLPIFLPFFYRFLPGFAQFRAFFAPFLHTKKRVLPDFAQFARFRPNLPEFVCFRSSALLRTSLVWRKKMS